MRFLSLYHPWLIYILFIIYLFFQHFVVRVVVYLYPSAAAVSNKSPQN